MSESWLTVIDGDGPVVLAQPHTGTTVPDAVAERLNDRGRELVDTDWHIDRLYDGLLPGATIVRTGIHRYVIDANRDPAGGSLYPGQNTTGLCPEIDFDGNPIWLPGAEPTAEDIHERLGRYHAPYHAAIEAALSRAHARYGVAVLYDCHSIRSVVPHLFDGTLPVLNVGTNGRQTAAAAVIESVLADCRAATAVDHVLDGRFKGGWTTRHYGRPAVGIHAVQMEIAQRAYMEEAPPWTWRQDRADALRAVLRPLLAGLEALALDATSGRGSGDG